MPYTCLGLQGYSETTDPPPPKESTILSLSTILQDDLVGTDTPLTALRTSCHIYLLTVGLVSQLIGEYIDTRSLRRRLSGDLQIF